MSKFDNVTGSFMIAVMGCLFWPFVLWAYLKQRKTAKLRRSSDRVLLNVLVTLASPVDDPVKSCEYYKEHGCSFVDGMDCDMKTCNILKDYQDEKAKN